MENKTLMKYIATWCWQIIAMQFLIASLICFALPRDVTTAAFYVGLFLVFVYCEYRTLKNQQELYKK